MHPSILLIGNFLSDTSGVKSVSEELFEYLHKSSDRCLITTSSHRSRILRLVDIVMTIILQRSKYEAVSIEVYSGLAFVWAEVSAWLLSWLHKPFVLALHGGGLPLLAEHSPARVRRLLSMAAAVITPSQYIQKALTLIRDDIIYLPNGLKLEDHYFRLRTDPAPRICWLRAFHKIYNPVMAIQVICQLRKDFPDIHLTMIGPDKADGTYDQVVQMIRDHDLKDHVEVFGSVPKESIPSWLDKYDVFINTTSLESFGVAVMEAGAAGLPIVTTNVGELPYLWKNENDALLIPPNDANAMAMAVRRILTEPGLAEKLSCSARKNAERFDWAVILPQWEHLMGKIVEQRQK